MTKRTVTLFICLIILAVLLILNGTVFVVKDITVTDYYGQDIEDKQKIAELSKLSGNNIFTISESVAIENIESAMPDIKVVEIVRSFPSGVKVVVHKRIPILAVKNGEFGYVILDRECSVMSGLNTIEEYGDLITVVDGVNVTNAVLGNQITAEGNSVIRLSQIIESFERIGAEGYQNQNFCLIIENIAFSGDNVSIKMREGVELRFDASLDCLKKLQTLVSCFNDREEYRANGVLTVIMNVETGLYEAHYSAQ